MLNESQIQTLINIISELPGLMGIYIHGSVAKGTARPDSDLDIAILMHHQAVIDPEQFLAISGELQCRLPERPVQIGILSRKDVVFAKEVIAYGKRIYCADKTYCDTFAMYALSFYAELNEKRKNILRDYFIDEKI